MYMNKAYLLDINGNTIQVDNHPSIHIESDFIIIYDLVEQYGSDKLKEYVKLYKETGTHKDDILKFYCQNWCKIRTWGTYYDEVTFRITSIGVNWYHTIVEFLLKHTEYYKSSITVEADKLEGSRRIY